MRLFLAALVISGLLSYAPVCAKELPEDYPKMATKSVLSSLDAFGFGLAKAESPSLADLGDCNRQLAYWLDSKDYTGLREKLSPVNFQLITPYSTARYLYYKADAQLKPLNQAALDEIVDYSNIVYLWVWSENMPQVHKTKATITNVVVKKNGLIYQPLPQQYISGTVLSLFAGREHQLWAFPADLFDGKSNVEIIAVDAKDRKNAAAVPAEKQREYR